MTTPPPQKKLTGKYIAVALTNADRVVGLEDKVPFAATTWAKYKKFVGELTTNQIRIVGTGGFKTHFDNVPPEDGNLVLVSSHADELWDANPALRDGSRIKPAYTTGDVVTYLKRIGTVRNRWLLGGPTLVAKSMYWIDRIELVVVDEVVAPEGEHVIHHFPKFEHLFEEPVVTDLGWAKRYTYTKKPEERAS